MDSNERNMQRNILEKLDGYRNENIPENWARFEELLDAENIKQPPKWLLPGLAIVSVLLMCLGVLFMLKTDNQAIVSNANNNKRSDKNSPANLPGKSNSATSTLASAENKTMGSKSERSNALKYAYRTNAKPLALHNKETGFANPLRKTRKNASHKTHNNGLEGNASKNDGYQTRKPESNGSVNETAFYIKKDYMQGLFWDEPQYERNLKLPDTLKICCLHTDAFMPVPGKKGKNETSSKTQASVFSVGLVAGNGFSNILSNTHQGYGFHYLAGVYADKNLTPGLSILLEPVIDFSTGNALEKTSKQETSFLFSETAQVKVVTDALVYFNFPVSVKWRAYKTHYLTVGAYGNCLLNSVSSVEKQRYDGIKETITVQHNISGYTDGINVWSYGISLGYMMHISDKWRLRGICYQNMSDMIDVKYFTGTGNKKSLGCTVTLAYKIAGL